MPVSTDITLPRDQEARFPDVCVACGHEQPSGAVRTASGPVWWGMFFSPFRRSTVVRAPACRGCALRLRAFAVARRLGTIVLAIVLILTLAPTLHGWVPWMPPFLVGLLLVVVASIPGVILLVVRPPAFDITVRPRQVTYEFRDVAIGVRFAAENGTGLTLRR